MPTPVTNGISNEKHIEICIFVSRFIINLCYTFYINKEIMIFSSLPGSFILKSESRVMGHNAKINKLFHSNFMAHLLCVTYVHHVP